MHSQKWNLTIDRQSKTTTGVNGEIGVNRLSLNTKLWLALLITWIGLLGLGAWSAWQSRTTMPLGREAAVQNVVECAYSLVAEYAGLADRLELTPEQAKQQGIGAIVGIALSG